MFNLGDIANENNKEYNEKWPYIPDDLNRILIIGSYQSGKTNTLLILMKEQDDIDKIYLYSKNLSEPKYKFLIKKREDKWIKHLNDSKAFIECSNTIDTVYENINDYIPTTRRKNLIVFDGMIEDIMSNKKLETVVKNCFLDAETQIFPLYLSHSLIFLF